MVLSLARGLSGSVLIMAELPREKKRLSKEKIVLS